MVNEKLSDEPLAFVILDILSQLDGGTWYTVERAVPTHPDFVGFNNSVRVLLGELESAGYLRSADDEPTPRLRLTERGARLHDELAGRRMQNPAVAAVRFDRDAWADSPGPVFAGNARFGVQSRTWPLRGQFLDSATEWEGPALITVLDSELPSDLLVPEARFYFVDGEVEVGCGQIILAAQLGGEKKDDE